MMRHLATFIGLVILSSCSDTPAGDTERLSAVDILAAGDVEGFERATAPRTFTYPEDHGPHPGYRNEWWYLTGNVATAEGRRFGYQVTFFTTAIRPEDSAGCVNDNAWCTDHVWMGHAAVSDIGNETHLAAELFSRQAPGLAGARLDPFRVWIQDWQLFAVGNGFPWELEVISDDFAITLRLDPEKQPILQGDKGLSRKSADPGNASYYYSITRINTSGQVHINGVSHAVNGSSWLDREWSTSALAADQSGWDWFSLQFNDHSELMYYQLRNLEGGAHVYSSGNHTSLMGAQSAISRDELALEELDSWQAPDGTDYTTRWRMRYKDNDWIIQAVFADQLMDVTFQYWEGAVDVIEQNSGEVIGRGYLEMVR
jgi:predicted secreted hydrolase